MKNLTCERLLFSSICNKKLRAVFHDGRVTPNAGVLALREVKRQIKLIDSLTDAIVDPGHPSYVRHQIREMIAQRVFPWPRAGNDLPTLRPG